MAWIQTTIYGNLEPKSRFFLIPWAKTIILYFSTADLKSVSKPPRMIAKYFNISIFGGSTLELPYFAIPGSKDVFGIIEGLKKRNRVGIFFHSLVIV